MKAQLFRIKLTYCLRGAHGHELVLRLEDSSSNSCSSIPTCCFRPQKERKKEEDYVASLLYKATVFGWYLKNCVRRLSLSFVVSGFCFLATSSCPLRAIVLTLALATIRTVCHYSHRYSSISLSWLFFFRLSLTPSGFLIFKRNQSCFFFSL